MVQNAAVSPQVEAGLHPAHATQNAYLNGMLWADARYTPGKATYASKPLRNSQPLGLLEQWVEMLNTAGLTVDFLEFMDYRGAVVRLNIYAEEKIFREFPPLRERELPPDADDAFAIGVLHSLFSVNRTHGPYISRNSLSEQAWLKLFGELPPASTPSQIKVPANVYAEHPGFELLHECVEDHFQALEEGRTALTEELDESLEDPAQRLLMMYRTAYPKLLWADMARLAKYSGHDDRFIVTGPRGTRSFHLLDGPDEHQNALLRQGLESVAETLVDRDHQATGSHAAEDAFREAVAQALMEVRGWKANRWLRIGSTTQRHERAMMQAFGVAFQNMGIDARITSEHGRATTATTYFLEVNQADFHRIHDTYSELPRGRGRVIWAEYDALLASLLRIYHPVYFMSRYVRGSSGGGYRPARSLPGVRDAGVKTRNLKHNPFAKTEGLELEPEPELDVQDEPEPEAPEPEPTARNILHRNPWA